MPTVSIIVPVYNVELYLNRCIDSILAQTYADFELVLVDDGSTDRSGEICDEYSLLDNRVMVIHQSNRGVSAARNAGLHNASGKYIQFVDSDDYVLNTITEKMVDCIEKYLCDLVFCGFTTISMNSLGIIEEEKYFINNRISDIDTFFSDFHEYFLNCLINSPCNKLYIRALIINNQILFSPNISLGEDLMFNLDYLGVIRSTANISEELYYYSINIPTSLNNKYIPNKFLEEQKLYILTRTFLVEHEKYFNKNREAIETTIANHLLAHISSLDYDVAEDKYSYIKSLINDSEFSQGLKYSRFIGKRRIYYYILQFKLVFLLMWINKWKYKKTTNGK